MAKMVYFFGQGKAEGSAAMKDRLGGKGANLAEMTRLGIPVPPGFTISTTACKAFYSAGMKLDKELRDQVTRALQRLERLQGKKFGDERKPLLVSVRSGAKFSMPGMMDTILNLGLNDRSVEGLAESTGDARFAYDAYRRFIQMYGDVVLGIGKKEFEHVLTSAKRARRVEEDTKLTAEDLRRLVGRYKTLVRKGSGRTFPQDPVQQLWGAISAVFLSWNNERAKLYRRQYSIPDDLGTAVNVQSMVFGNLGANCATGVAFTRNPSDGEDILYGEYLPNAQGEDVVAGIRTPLPISKRQSDGDEIALEEFLPECYRQLLEIRQRLERHYRDMQDVEFTIEKGKLYMLQTRTGKRTGLAAMRIAFDLHAARVIDQKTVVQRVEPDMVVQLLAPVFDEKELEEARAGGRVIARGLPAGPGAAAGVVATTAQQAAKLAAKGRKVVLVREETSPEDLAGMVASSGIVTSRGGMTSHAAVVARGMGKPCVVGADALRVDERAGTIRVGSKTLGSDESLSINGTTGEVIDGALDPHPSEIQKQLLNPRAKEDGSELFRRFALLMRWADRYRTMKVRTNADTPKDSEIARAFGAEGIGLCRTEHMFFADERITAVRRLILAEDPKQRQEALRQLLPMQRKDFVGMFTAMKGLPVTVRLLDPPLHEFLPTEPEQFRKLSKETGIPVRRLEEKAAFLHESNPMMGHRGCRLGVTFPEIYDMQVRAILEAAIVCKKKKIKVRPEIMIPLVGTVREIRDLAARVGEVATHVEKKSKLRVPYMVGTMIEIPRACLVAEEIAREAEFFSFGTNDLTQLTYGYSRDDAGKFLPAYLRAQILPADPFEKVDREGVGELVATAVQRGRRGRPSLKIGVCGEHGGDADSVAFFNAIGVDYVSCSPYRVPVARLAAAHAALSGGRGAGSETA